MKVCFIHFPKCGGPAATGALMRLTTKHRGLDVQAARLAAAFLDRKVTAFSRDVLTYYLYRRDLDLLHGHFTVNSRLLDAHTDWDFVTILRTTCSWATPPNVQVNS